MRRRKKPAVFISHSRRDKQLVCRLAADLSSHGISVWVDEGKILPGQDIVSAIEDGLHRATHVLLVISRNSLLSNWVVQERNAAQVLEIKNRNTIIPILAGSAAPEQIPLLLQSRLYVDFRNPRTYSRQLELLLKAISGKDTASLCGKAGEPAGADGGLDVISFDIDPLCVHKKATGNWKPTSSDTIRSYYRDYLPYFSDAARELVQKDGDTPEDLARYLRANPVNRIPDSEALANYLRDIPIIYSYFRRKAQEYSATSAMALLERRHAFLQYFFYIPEELRMDDVVDREEARTIIEELARQIFEREKSIPPLVYRNAYCFVQEPLPVFIVTARSHADTGIIVHGIEVEVLATSYFLGIGELVLHPMRIFNIMVPAGMGVTKTHLDYPVVVPQTGVSFGLRLFTIDRVKASRVMRISLLTEYVKVPLPLIEVDM